MLSLEDVTFNKSDNLAKANKYYLGCSPDYSRNPDDSCNPDYSCSPDDSCSPDYSSCSPSSW